MNKETEQSKQNGESRNFRISDLPCCDKPREKALKNGITSLTETELLAIIFSTGLKGKSVLDLSREILNDADTRLDKLSKLTVKDLTNRYKGVGEAKALSLVASIEFGRRCQRAIDSSSKTDPQLKSSETVYNLMKTELENIPHEEFWILHLSRANRIISRDCISRGGTAMTVVDIKLVMKKAIENLASGLIFVHNHPSGNLSPSEDDDRLTRRLKEAAGFFDISVLDHLIIGAGGYYSYNDEGRL